MRRWYRLRALGGLLGPAVFTAAWAVSSRRQEGYSIREEHISGLAAPDAHDPGLMVAGFLVLGAGTIAAGSALEDALGGCARAGWAPRLVQASGVAALAAGLLRRDRMLLHPPAPGDDAVLAGGARDAVAPPDPARRLGLPARPQQSWHNDGHDLAAGVVYLCLVAAPVALARRVAADGPWHHLVRPALAGSAVTVAALGLFATERLAPWNGVVQRAMVTLPGIELALLALDLLRQTPA